MSLPWVYDDLPAEDALKIAVNSESQSPSGVTPMRCHTEARDAGCD